MITFEQRQAAKLLATYMNPDELQKSLDEENDIEKAAEVGTINKYGKQKQADGSWKYVGKNKANSPSSQTSPAHNDRGNDEKPSKAPISAEAKQKFNEYISNPKNQKSAHGAQIFDEFKKVFEGETIDKLKSGDSYAVAEKRKKTIKDLEDLGLVKVEKINGKLRVIAAEMSKPAGQQSPQVQPQNPVKEKAPKKEGNLSEASKIEGELKDQVLDLLVGSVGSDMKSLIKDRISKVIDEHTIGSFIKEVFSLKNKDKYGTKHKWLGSDMDVYKKAEKVAELLRSKVNKKEGSKTSGEKITLEEAKASNLNMAKYIRENHIFSQSQLLKLITNAKSHNGGDYFTWDMPDGEKARLDMDEIDVDRSAGYNMTEYHNYKYATTLTIGSKTVHGETRFVSGGGDPLSDAEAAQLIAKLYLG